MSRRKLSHPHIKPSDFLTITKAAAHLGVCAETLRNWDRTNKFKALRHPINGYRIYNRNALDALLLSINVK